MRTVFTIFFITIILVNLVFAQTDSTWFDTRIRRIHMDFHTPEISHPDIIKKFDAKEYVKTLKNAHVNSLVTFAKCHHGNSYYNTEIGHKHNGLPHDTDMFGEIVNECHANDLKVLAYYSVGWLTTVEKNHPEWMERDVNGQKMGTDGKLRTDSWNCICLNSPYMKNIVIPEIIEIVSNYEIDGFWIDIIENNPCFCEWCQKKFKAENHSEYPDHKSKLIDFALQTKKETIQKLVRAVKNTNPNVLVTFNTAGRDPQVVPLVDFCSIETHPGATWHQTAWTHSLLTMKCLQRYDKPWESTTSRFIHGWGGWDDQTTENMLVVASRIAAHGGVINLGDQTYPTGQLDTELYKKIGKVYSKIEKMEKWAIKGKSAAEIAIFTTPFDIYSIYRDPTELNNYLGAAKILTDNHYDFDLVVEGEQSDISKYKCLVLPNVGKLAQNSILKLENYVKRGGKLLVTGNSSFNPELNNFDLADVLGVTFKNNSPFSNGYIQLNEDITGNLRRSPLLVPGPFFEITLKSSSKTLGDHVYPIIEPLPSELLFFRNKHLSPPGNVSNSPAIVFNNYHQGQIIYSAAPLCEIFMDQSQWYLKDVVDNLLGYLNLDLDITVTAPKSVEVYQTKKDNHHVVHVINYFLHKETNQIEELVPINNIQINVKNELIDKNSIKIIGEHAGFSTTEIDGRLVINIDKVDFYSQLIFKTK